MPTLQVLLIAFSVILVDRITKSVAEMCLAYGASVPVIPDIFHFTLIHNTGAAFGLLKGGALFFVLMTLVCIVSILLFLRDGRLLKKFFGFHALDGAIKLSFGLVLGGAAGNLIDRVTVGHVIDFLDFRVWPVFNLADSAITVGGAILFFKIVLHNREVRDDAGSL